MKGNTNTENARFCALQQVSREEHLLEEMGRSIEFVQGVHYLIEMNPWG